MTQPFRPGAPRALVLGALLLATAACHDVAGPGQTAPTPTRETRLIATASGKSAANDVLLVQAISAALGGGGTSADGSLALRGAAARTIPSADIITYGGLTCTYNASRSLFECPSMTLESMTIRAEFALFDADSVPQSAYDDVATTSATIWYWAKGTLVNPDGGAAIDRERELTVTNLQSGATERIFAGVGTDRAEGELPGNSAQRYVLNDTTIADGITVGAPFSANVWPLRGTLTTRSQLDITDGGTPISTTHRRVVITFDGTQFVEMTVENPATSATSTYTLDLATGDLTPDP